MNIERVVENLKDNAVPLLLGVGGVGVLFLLLSGKEEEAELVPATGYMSYPDAVTNANVIIGEVNDHTTAEVAQLREEQEAGVNTILDSLLSQNDYFAEGLDAILGNVNDNTADVMGALGDLGEAQKENHSSLIDLVNQNKTEIQTTLKENHSSLKDLVSQSKNDIQSAIKENHSSLKDLVSQSKNDIQSAIKENGNKTTYVPVYTTPTTPTTKPTTTSTTKKPTTTSTTKKPATSTTSYYTYKTKAGLNTSQSIVDALKATGVNSSFNYRKKIAQANGISNYTGTASQNVSLLNKLKSGKLKKV